MPVQCLPYISILSSGYNLAMSTERENVHVNLASKYLSDGD